MQSEQVGPEMPFEQAFSHLEDVIQRLEEGDLPLERALALYEQGMELARRCQALLDQAELRVTQLLEIGEEVQEAPFEEGDS